MTGLHQNSDYLMGRNYLKVNFALTVHLVNDHRRTYALRNALATCKAINLLQYCCPTHSSFTIWETVKYHQLVSSFG